MPMDKLVQDWFSFTPNIGRNTTGKHVAKTLIGALLQAIPGGGPEFENKFSYLFHPLQGDSKEWVMSTLGQPLSWWQDFATAVIIQGIYQYTKEVRNQINIGQANVHVDEANHFLRTRCWKLYSALIEPQSEMHPPEELGKRYLAHFKSSEWIAAKLKQSTSGDWLNPEWELYHHYLKMIELGVHIHDIDDAISHLEDRLSIPDIVGRNNWRTYDAWWEYDVDHRLLDQHVHFSMKRSHVQPMFPKPLVLSEFIPRAFVSRGAPGFKYLS